jgi:hypothetical protein
LTLDAHGRAAERALGALAPPTGRAPAWRQLLADRHVLALRLVTPSHANGTSGAAGQPAPIRIGAAGQPAPIRKRLQTEATKLGARDCGLI